MCVRQMCVHQMHVRQMRIPAPTVIVYLARNKQKISSCNIIVYVCMPVFVIKCYVRQMRHCKVCLKGRGGLGGGVSLFCSKH